MKSQNQIKFYKIFFIFTLFVFCILLLLSCSNKNFFVRFYLMDYSTPWMVKEVKEGSVIDIIPEPENSAGYIFDGWYLDEDIWNVPFDSSIIIKSNLNVYGRYTKIISNLAEYKVTFKIDDQEQHIEKVYEGNVPQIYIPTLENKVFEGWYLDSNFAQEYVSKPVTSNIVLYGKWSTTQTLNDLFNFDSANNTILGFKAGVNTAISLFIPSKINGILIKKIGDSAFENTSIISLFIENQIEELGQYSFYKCLKLSSVQLPESLKFIGKSAFENCSKIENIQLPSGISKISDSTFKDCIDLKTINLTNSLKEIGNLAFKSTALEDLVIPESITKIGINAYWSSKIKNLYFQKSLGELQICKEAFRDCKELEEVFFEQSNLIYSQIIIGEGCFYENTNLKRVSLSENICRIEKTAFAHCKLLNSIKLPKNNSEFITLFEDTFLGCENLLEIEVPQTITEIKQGVFASCKNLGDINLSENIQRIGKNAFYNCLKLKVINAHMLQDLHTIGENAFAKCRSLEKFYLRECVTHIDAGAFNVGDSSVQFQVFVQANARPDTWNTNWITHEENRVFYGKSVDNYLSI
ncbi:MAG: leucine-rich repeat protein [Christensenellales bacterium]|jgi:hypothetical protein